MEKKKDWFKVCNINRANVIKYTNKNEKALLYVLEYHTRGATKPIRENQKELANMYDFGETITKKTMSSLRKKNILRFDQKHNMWYLNPTLCWTGTNADQEKQIGIYKKYSEHKTALIILEEKYNG